VVGVGVASMISLPPSPKLRISDPSGATAATASCPPPVLVVPQPPRLLSLARARPFGPDRLRAWLAGALS